MRRTLGPLLCTGALLLGTTACSDGDDDKDAGETSTTTPSTAPEGDDPALRVRGEDVELIGDGLGTQTVNIDVEGQRGAVTGEFQINDVVVRVDCTDTATDGAIILGGEVTDGDPGGVGVDGDLLALVIREGDPDALALVGNDAGATTCVELLESIPDDIVGDDDIFRDVQAGSGIEIA